MHILFNKVNINNNDEAIPRSESFISTKLINNESETSLKDKDSNKNPKIVAKLMGNGYTNKSFESTKTNDVYFEHVLTTPLLTIE